jgi:hypothetical protein
MKKRIEFDRRISKQGRQAFICVPIRFVTNGDLQKGDMVRVSVEKIDNGKDNK